jgi:ribosomal protein S10
MLIVYSLKLKSIHLKFLLLGVLALLKMIKKKEYIKIVGIRTKTKTKKIQKYTILKSPFINKSAREQFKLQIHSTVVFFSLEVFDKNHLFIEDLVELAVLKYLNSQYVEIKLSKKYIL